MNSIFTAKLLQNLRNKKGNKGFTLIELLVVVIIIGVLAAVALPNLLAQVGKARESEGKTGVGTINRAQQTFHFETGNFTPIANVDLASIGTNPLQIAVQSEYFEFDSINPGAVATDVVTTAIAPAGTGTPQQTAEANGTRAFAGRVDFLNGNFYNVLCQSTAVGATAPGFINTGAAGLACDPATGSPIR